MVLLFVLCVGSLAAIAQDPTTKAFDTLRGTVVNSVTNEPIGRALVFSPDNRFATMTDSYGVFEFKVPPDDSPSSIGGVIAGVPKQPNRPYMLSARKPGYLTDANDQHSIDPSAKEITIPLTPEALIIGHVTLPSSQPPDPIQVEIFRTEVRDGLAHWVSAGQTTTRSNGEFRFAELPAGSYKLLTHEQMDDDPLTAPPGQQAYAYPPAYYAKAGDFPSAAIIRLTPGKIYKAQLSLVRQPYYPVKIPVTGAPPGSQVGVQVSPQARKGPGFELGYFDRNQVITGLLPNGIYKVDAVGYGVSNSGGTVTINVNGPLYAPPMTLVSTPPIPVNVTESFTSTENPQATYTSVNGVVFKQGPRSYLNVTLNGIDDFAFARGASLRPPTGAGDTQLAIGNASPGMYLVAAFSARGYIASLTSGGVDLMHHPLVVPFGAEVAPIEITVRDDFAQLDGTIEGVAAKPGPQAGVVQSSAPIAYVYCVPSPDSSGQFIELSALADGAFSSNRMAPGVYHLLAFSHPQKDLEYRNPEAMRAYDGKGQVIRLVPGQKQQVQVSIISASE